MRTTVTIDDDVLDAAKTIARHSRSTLGEVISELARRSLARSDPTSERNGVPLLSTRPGSTVVTLDIVNTLRDEIA